MGTSRGGYGPQHFVKNALPAICPVCKQLMLDCRCVQNQTPIRRARRYFVWTWQPWCFDSMRVRLVEVGLRMPTRMPVRRFDTQ